MVEKQEIEQAILNTISDAELIIEDLTGEGKNFGISIISSKFEGMSVVQQHQLVYKALGDKLRQDMHAIKIHTSTK